MGGGGWFSKMAQKYIIFLTSGAVTSALPAAAGVLLRFLVFGLAGTTGFGFSWRESVAAWCGVVCENTSTISSQA